MCRNPHRTEKKPLMETTCCDLNTKHLTTQVLLVIGLYILSPVFEWHLKIRPFENRTGLDHSNTGLVRYSVLDYNCLHWFVGRQPWPVMNSLLFIDLDNNNLGDSLERGKFSGLNVVGTLKLRNNNITRYNNITSVVSSL